MKERKIIIFTALELERRAVARCVQQHENGTVDIEIITIGIRACRGSVWQSALNTVRQSPNACVIIAGVGGGLDPALCVGDVVIEAPNQPALQDLPFRFGRIHTSEDLICTAEAKSRLFQSTGALAVDMESALIRKASNADGVSIIGVRAISDSADTAIDPTLLSLVDDLGRPRFGRMARALMRRPAIAFTLRRLGRDTRLALRQLEIAVRQVVDRINRDPVEVPHPPRDSRA